MKNIVVIDCTIMRASLRILRRSQQQHHVLINTSSASEPTLYGLSCMAAFKFLPPQNVCFDPAWLRQQDAGLSQPGVASSVGEVHCVCAEGISPVRVSLSKAASAAKERVAALPPPSPVPPAGGAPRRLSNDGSMSNSSAGSRRGTREEPGAHVSSRLIQ